MAFESNGLFILVFGKRPRVIFPGFRDISGYQAMFADFVACIRSGREPLMTVARARRDLEGIIAKAAGSRYEPDRRSGASSRLCSPGVTGRRPATTAPPGR